MHIVDAQDKRLGLAQLSIRPPPQIFGLRKKYLASLLQLLMLHSMLLQELLSRTSLSLHSKPVEEYTENPAYETRLAITAAQ